MEKEEEEAEEEEEEDWFQFIRVQKGLQPTSSPSSFSFLIIRLSVPPALPFPAWTLQTLLL